MSNLCFLGIATDLSRLRPNQRMTEELPSRANSQTEDLSETNSRTEVPAGANPRSAPQARTGREIWKNTLSRDPSEKALTERCVRFYLLGYRTAEQVTAGAPWTLQAFSGIPIFFIFEENLMAREDRRNYFDSVDPTTVAVVLLFTTDFSSRR